MRSALSPSEGPLAVLIFVGGVGRVISMIHHGLPHPGFLAATVAELLFPLLVPWQRAVAATPGASALVPGAPAER